MRADQAILQLLRTRAPEASICPSEAARSIAGEDGDWRALMPRVREAAAKLAERGEVVITQRAVAVDVRTVEGPVRIARGAKDPSAYADAYREIDFRAHPERYRVGRGEQGVLLAEPYKSELLPLWRFRTPEIASESSQALWRAFVGYRKARDFVGMDMARKFLQMGFTRARRYANRRSGKKYDAGRQLRPRDANQDGEKARSAEIFYAVWQRAERDRVYRAWRVAQSKREVSSSVKN